MRDSNHPRRNRSMEPRCKVCEDRTWVELEKRIRIPCPACDMEAAVVALKTTVAFVETCAAYNRGELQVTPTPTGLETVRVPRKG